jgi:hypothetical protein
METATDHLWQIGSAKMQQRPKAPSNPRSKRTCVSNSQSSTSFLVHQTRRVRMNVLQHLPQPHIYHLLPSITALLYNWQHLLRRTQLRHRHTAQAVVTPDLLAWPSPPEPIQITTRIGQIFWPLRPHRVQARGSIEEGLKLVESVTTSRAREHRSRSHRSGENSILAKSTTRLHIVPHRCRRTWSWLQSMRQIINGHTRRTSYYACFGVGMIASRQSLPLSSINVSTCALRHLRLRFSK